MSYDTSHGEPYEQENAAQGQSGEQGVTAKCEVIVPRLLHDGSAVNFPVSHDHSSSGHLNASPHQVRTKQ